MNSVRSIHSFFVHAHHIVLHWLRSAHSNMALHTHAHVDCLHIDTHGLCVSMCMCVVWYMYHAKKNVMQCKTVHAKNYNATNWTP